MANSKDIQVTNLKLKVLVYGKSGTGKTTFACGFPKPFVFDFDGGMLSQRGKDIEYDTFTSWSSFQAKLQQLQGHCPYETIVLDSVTTMQEYMMKDILTVNKRTEPTLHEWGRLVDGLQALFMQLTKMANHLVVVAHEQVLQDEVTSEILVLPLIVGKKLPGQIPLWFDEVYRSQTATDSKTGKAVYQILTTAGLRYVAKSRLGVLDPIEVPSYQVIMGKVRG